MNTYHRRWATETIDSVIPRLKEAGFKKEEAYMFMFMDSKMYKGANKKFLSSREKQFIKTGETFMNQWQDLEFDSSSPSTKLDKTGGAVL